MMTGGFTLILVSLNVYLTYFIIAAIIQSYKTVSKNFHRVKYQCLSKILHEQNYLFNREYYFKNTGYIVHMEKESDILCEKFEKK